MTNAICSTARIYFFYQQHHKSPQNDFIYEGHLESKERFAIKKYLLTIEKKNNMQVLSHTFTYFST